MSAGGFYPRLSPFKTGLACRCPRCGRGRIFSGFLKIAETCPVCGLDLGGEDAGDGPAVFIILFMGALVVLLALLTEAWFSPPYWVHMVLWGPLVLIGSLLLMRPFKGIMVALQYRHKAGEGGGRLG
ncbi:MAG TPA: DUF983 domain-containing protein [Hypericibacter adhaerens]|jgi:uncharacterized protein (DUF983 family)|uniref:Membrane protein n=1 Tax=Hypericibacter adhaerens TaxID=2602016 RepID=A0A5J6MVT4_9PROT|nr:DUF983 domain-containing protein [Hypericibacter adhaerens]QEX20855.1 membrane protein [Hypericibacter adhaerens]HWA45882.1 DUF983 domain-containing protein [Hypericibacter adhaerens]